jgi:hypothetical protein
MMPMIVEKSREGVKNQQPSLHPQLIKIVLVGNTIIFGRDEAPVVQAAVERVQQLEHLKIYKTQQYMRDVRSSNHDGTI